MVGLRFPMVCLLLFSLLLQVPAALQSQAGVVTGVLRTDAGLPVEGVRVAVAPADAAIADSVLESQALTDSTGRYRLESVSPGRYNILIGRLAVYRADLPRVSSYSGPRLSTYHPGVTELSQATVVQVVAGSTLEVSEMVFTGKAVSGRVVDLATGRGVRIGSLFLCCDYSQPVMMGAGPVNAAVFQAYVSDDGSFVFPAVPAGNYYLSTADPSVLAGSWALAVGENGVSGLRLDVTEGVEVQGSVLDQTGKPVTASIRLRPKPASSASGTIGAATNAAVTGALFLGPKEGSSLDSLQEQLLKSARTHSADTPGPDGRFTLRGVYPGPYVLEVHTGGVNLLQREIQVGTAGSTTVSLQVPAIQVTGRVIAPGGGPMPKLHYVRLLRSGADADVFYGFPDAEGRFSIALVPGEYRVFTERLGPPVQSVSDGSRDITNMEFTFEAGRDPQLVVTLEP